MRRKLFTLAAGVSAVLCVVGFALGRRSYHKLMAVPFTWNGVRWELVLNRGVAWVDNEPERELDRERRRAGLQSGAEKVRTEKVRVRKRYEVRFRPRYFASVIRLTNSSGPHAGNRASRSAV
jgi:hypothetical protein